MHRKPRRWMCASYNDAAGAENRVPSLVLRHFAEVTANQGRPDGLQRGQRAEQLFIMDFTNANMPFFRRIAQSIVTRILLLTVFLAIGASFLRHYYLTGVIRDDMLKVELAQQDALARDMARDIDYKIVERRELLQRLAASFPLELMGKPQSLRAWLQQRHDVHPVFSGGILVLDRNGQFLSDY
ncbi:MAG: hypothetical protein KGM99_13470, partial [Burkholderiales bacterium]|nr:hypothetical protein [Burkholderiales bacterium]